MASRTRSVGEYFAHEQDQPGNRSDPRLCAAVVDRLTFNGAIIQTNTDSCRFVRTKAPAGQAATG